MAEIGDVRRFHSKKALVAFAGIDAPPYHGYPQPQYLKARVCLVAQDALSGDGRYPLKFACR
jgi:hypothetical protein